MVLDTDLARPDGRSVTWTQVRDFVLADRPMCAICGVVEATEVDHVWPRYFGGTEEVANLQPTCGTCNRSKGIRVDAASAPERQIAVAVGACMVRAVAAVEEADQFIAALYQRIGAEDDAGRRRVRAGVLSAECSALVLDSVLAIRRSQLRRMVEVIRAEDNQ